MTTEGRTDTDDSGTLRGKTVTSMKRVGRKAAMTPRGKNKEGSRNFARNIIIQNRQMFSFRFEIMENDLREINLIDAINAFIGPPQEYDPENPGMKRLVGTATSA